jgi:hypothetical protein
MVLSMPKILGPFSAAQLMMPKLEALLPLSSALQEILPNLR